ncbi:MAG TPA: glutamate--tRNA ligase [Thermoanaerobaculia bacterium]|nr:glutamate--tRNA ligase [Thermoanaerobaculia bacterium]HUM28920.1 glutamate--tRNA ligase [Thermoanaerobaculia bacterium]HXK67147.1 glutamate--tRNA ligase [Thermoanaerobaculia bacterium]
MTVRVRFAPSPTGYLHVGGARTAVYNYLFARKRGGTFILRIEDTDVERSTQAAIATILEGMEWMGLSWDEGPFYQSQGLKDHVEAANRLIDQGAAYRCFATSDELKEQREAFMKEGKTWRYDERYRSMDPEESKAMAERGVPYVIRFRVPRETGKIVSFQDLVYGPQERSTAEMEDFAMVRPDGSPLYNLSVVMDDSSMNISHVIRGQDHLANTFKQILLYESLGKPTPEFAHLPLILAPDKSKLSKRKHGEVVSVTAYRDRGFLPHAFVNFLSLVGWNPGEDREIMSMDELVELFDLSRVNRANAVFNFDESRGEWTDKKAIWMNGQYISSTPIETLIPWIRQILQKHDLWSDSFENECRNWFIRCMDQLRQRFFSLEDFATLGRAYLSDEYAMDPAGYEKRVLKQAEPLLDLLPKVISLLEEIDPFEHDPLDAAITSFCERENVKMGLINNAIRVLVTGQPVGPGIYEVLSLIGKERVLMRLQKGLSNLQ